jgi:hypothetical protein
MEEMQAQARLVGSDDSLFAGGGVSTTLPRTEIERALAEGEYPARLDLQIKRLEGGREEDAHLAISWEEQELRELLSSISDDDVTLLFDRDALELALEDVEAHGMRERAAVIAVAIAAAGAGAGGAFAHPQLDSSSSGAAAPAAQVADGPDVVAVAPGTHYAPLPGQSVVTPGHSPRGPAGVATSATPTEAPDAVAVAPGAKYAPLPGQSVVTPGQSPRGPAGAGTAATPSEAPDVVAVVPGSRYEQLPGQTVVTPTADQGAPAADTGTGSGSSLTVGEDAAIATGAALLIAAAGFGAAQARRRPARPA